MPDMPRPSAAKHRVSETQSGTKTINFHHSLISSRDMRVRQNKSSSRYIHTSSSPEGGFGVEKVFLFLCAGTLLDLLLADFITPLSVSSSPSAGPETLIIEALSKLQTTVKSLSICQSCHKVALVGSFPCRLDRLRHL